MEDQNEAIKKFYLLTDTHKIDPQPDFDELLQLVKKQEYWDKVLSLEIDTPKFKEFFKTLELEKREEYFKFAISCFICFVQKNFTGPLLEKEVEEFFNKDAFTKSDFVNRLTMNNEDINVNTRFPVLLVVSEIIFDTCVVADVVNLWWCCRALMIHQEILDELSPTLLSNADRLCKLIQGITLEPYIKANLDIELAQLYQKFSHISKSKELITSASELLGLEYTLVGKLGKRTKYQTEDIAQLTLEINLSDKEDLKRPPIEDFTLPKNLSLEDDVRLDEIKFNQEIKYVMLPNTEQKLLLAIIQQKFIASPPDELQVEEILPFVEYLLRQKNTYCVRAVALLFRCKLECKHKRTIERCLKTSEELIKSFTVDDVSVYNKFGDVFGAGLPPQWNVIAKYADSLLNFGLVKMSLDVYLKLKLWEEVVVCYTILKLRHKAAEVIREQLAIKPTVKLMCLLGDATDDVSCYEKAWEMSKRRSHRAQRHWGKYFYERKKYEDCIPHFEKSLSINPLQANIWLKLGYAALKVENWHTAATAYRRYTTLEPDGFEAWNNLAQAYINIGNKRSAHQAILEALKCNFDNWKVWENLLVVSCDISNFSDVIRAYHRLLDLKEKYLNVEVLNVLVYSVCNDSNDSDGNPARKFLQKTRELVGRITALYPGNGVVWELYSCLAPVMLLRAQRLQRAYRGYTQGCWDKDPKACFQVLNVCSKLADIVLDDEIDPSNTIISSIKLNLSAAVAVCRKHDYDETKTLVEEVSNQLEQVIEKIQKGNAAFKVDVS